MITNFEQLLKQAKQVGPKTVALAVAQDEAAISALVQAKKHGLAEARLFGDRGQVGKVLETVGAVVDDFPEIHHVADENEATARATLSVKTGESDILLKGRVKTGPFLKCVLDAERGLRTGRLLSDVFMFEASQRSDNQLVMITDGGVTLAPNLEQKVAILKNAVDVAHKLGNANPKVAVLSAVETVHAEMPSTVDAALIAKMNERGQIKGCVVEGPLGFDNAVSLEAARVKNLDSPVAGRAEILVFPTIEAANICAKGLTYFANVRLAHVIMGAAAPVLIPSRADSADAKLLSIALGILMCSS